MFFTLGIVGLLFTFSGAALLVVPIKRLSRYRPILLLSGIIFVGIAYLGGSKITTENVTSVDIGVLFPERMCGEKWSLINKGSQQANAPDSRAQFYTYQRLQESSPIDVYVNLNVNATVAEDQLYGNCVNELSGDVRTEKWVIDGKDRNVGICTTRNWYDFGFSVDVVRMVLTTDLGIPVYVIMMAPTSEFVKYRDELRCIIDNIDLKQKTEG